MSDLNVRSDSVDVDQIMKQIRTRIKEKRGSDYTEAELQQLASVKLEQFADPSGLRSDLLDQFRQRSNEPSTYQRHHGPRRWLLMLLHPLLKRIQKQLMADLNLYFEIIHNLVIETTRLGIETQNLKMRVESLSSRMDFDERRSRALEGVVQYRPDALPRQRTHEPSRPAPTPQSSSAPAPRQSYDRGHNSPAASAPAPAPQSAPAASGTTSPAPAVTVASNAPAGGATSGTQGAPGAPGARPDGRRRRRRRRRRPGQTLAESPSAGGGSGADYKAPVSSGQDSSDADGPDEDDGASDQ